MPSPLFNEESSVGPRDWGEEILLAHVEGNFTFKKLVLSKGCKGGLQYHRFKNEAGFLVSGKLLIRYEESEGQLSERIISPGESFHFPPFAVHQEEALDDCIIIEASTPVFNDRVRCEENYGITDLGQGLPSTNETDVVFK